MKVLAALCGTAVVLFSMAGCSPAPTPAPPDTHDADVKAISDLEAKQVADFGAKNIEALIAFYADDAVLMTPGGPSAKGKDAIERNDRGPCNEVEFQGGQSGRFQGGRPWIHTGHVYADDDKSSHT